MFLRNWVTGGIVAKMRGFFILLYKSTLNGQIVLAEKCGSLRLRSYHHQLHQDDGCHLAGCVFVELVKGEALWPGKSDVDQLYLIRFPFTAIIITIIYITFIKYHNGMMTVMMTMEMVLFDNHK